MGNNQKTVTVKVPCGLIIGDMQGGDKHSGRCVNYNSKTINRLCRQCNVTGDDSGDPHHKCKKISMNIIKEYVSSNQIHILKELNQHNVHLAWFDVDFGGCPYGVFSAAMPLESLHALEGGLIKNILQILFTQDLKPLGCANLDYLIIEMCTWPRQFYLCNGSNNLMPCLKFKDGVSSLSKISSRDMVGEMFDIFVISLTDKGSKLLIDILTQNFKGNTRKAKTCFYDLKYLFSMILACWSWLQKETYWQRGDNNSKKIAEHSIKTLMITMQKLWPRADGNGWNIPKFHKQLHIPRDIERHGSPQNVYAGPTEKHHKHTKNHTQHTQKDVIV